MDWITTLKIILSFDAYLIDFKNYIPHNFLFFFYKIGSWCYEIAPNKEDCDRNIVSKRCIISKQNAEKLSSDFLSHFNQYVNF